MKLPFRRTRRSWKETYARGVADFEQHFGAGILGDTLAEARSHVGPVRVVEIGCGFGHLLLDLCRAHPELELHGINRRPWPEMQGEESLRQFALDHGIFTSDELRARVLPTIHFRDACELPFDPNSVDLIVSQVAIHYVRRKDLLLREVWRVLRPGGQALLHIDTRREDAPDFLRSATPRFVIYRGDRVVPLSCVLDELGARGFDLRLDAVRRRDEGSAGERVHLLMRKSCAEALPLELAVDATSSFNLALLVRPRHRKQDRKHFYGYRSVFRDV